MWFAKASHSLAARLIVWFTIAATALLLLAAAALYTVLVQGVEWRDDQVLMKRAATVRELVHAKTLDPVYLDHEVSEDLEGPRQLFIRVAGPPEIGIHETPLMPKGLVFGVPDGALDTFQFSTATDSNGFRYRTATLQTLSSKELGAKPVAIQLALDTHLDSSVLRHYTEISGLVVLCGLAFSALLGWWVVRSQLAPLPRLSSQMAEIEHSTLDRRVPIHGQPAELAELALQFNRMIERLEKAYIGLKRYADDVAHELRTPLNRIQLETEVALRSARTPEEYRKALSSTLDDCEHLNAMVKSLLFIARAENGRTDLRYERLNIAERLETIRSFFEDSAEEAGVKLTLSCDPAISMNADATLLQRAVSNIVANSLAHTPKGGEVKMSAEANGTGVTIEVADTGEGIAPEHQPYVFDRFFRGDAARRTDKDRVGLGLAITKSIIDLHRGRIALESAPASGTRFTLFFPAA
jgi:two-component system heavy metal sensor histidine kinase CusS